MWEDYTALSEIGKKIISLYLKREIPTYKIGYDVQGSDIIKNIKYKNNKIYINNKQYFDEVKEEAWEFTIGGHQVIKKWLRYRKNMKLSSEDLQHIIRVIEIIHDTIGYMNDIDTYDVIKN